MAEDTPLTSVERLALKFAEALNETSSGKWVQTKFLRAISYPWIRACLANRLLAEGLDELNGLRPDRGVMMVANHRSFFDQYALLLQMFTGRIHWARELYFPVRSNFFYDRLAGIAVNAAIAGGAMYPPIYRQAERRAKNDEALDKMVEILERPGALLGMHPEGTRGKGTDPYELLPAQPGVGKVALLAKPIVVPVFIHGLGNNIVEDIKWNFGSEARTRYAVITIFGQPIDYGHLLAEKPRPTLYKKCADLFMAEIKKLMAREKLVRAEVDAGRVFDDDPRWLLNRPASNFYAREPRA